MACRSRRVIARRCASCISPSGFSCRSSRSSIRQAPIPGSAPKSAGRAKLSRAICSRWRRCKTPIVSVVIGEGGSGGALAIGVCDRLLMLQYSIYSVISPEGCAGILWRSAEKKDLAAEAMGVSAERIAKLGVVDEVIKEPLGGAHRDPQMMADSVKDAAAAASERVAGASARAAHEVARGAVARLRRVQRRVVSRFSPSALLACVAKPGSPD